MVITIAPSLTAQLAIGHLRTVGTKCTIFVSGQVVVRVVALHRHTTQRQIIVITQMESQSGTCKESAAIIIVLALTELIAVERRTRAGTIALIAHIAAITLTFTIADIGIGIHPLGGIVDVTTHVPAFLVVHTRLDRAIIAGTTVALQNDIDNTGSSLRRIFGTGVVDNFDTLNALGWYLLENLGTVVAGQSAALTIDPHLHTGVATQRNLTIGGHLYRRDVFQQVAHRATSSCQHLVNGEGFTIYLELHL